MVKNRTMNAALMAEADPVAYAKANMDTLRSTYFVSKAVVTMAARDCAKMQSYGAAVIGTLDAAQISIGNAVGIRNGNDAPAGLSATFGITGDIEAGFDYDINILPSTHVNYPVGPGDAKPKSTVARMSASAFLQFWLADLNASDDETCRFWTGQSQLHCIPVLKGDKVILSAASIVATP